MLHLLGDEWTITPAGGATGDAFIALHTNDAKQKLFLKRNTSPFLAVLSAEGIVPKLVWTRRLENGDVITAQRWLDGRVLKSVDMSLDRVAKMLRKIHDSNDLLQMLKRIGKQPLLPEMILDDVKTKALSKLKHVSYVQTGLQFLEEEVPHVGTDHQVVCHGDIHHHNWLLSEENELYLIDWDGAVIADPAIDLGMLLYSYIPRNEWSAWMALYGVALTDQLQIRMKWYSIAQTIEMIYWNHEREKWTERDIWVDFLSELLT